MRLLAWAAIEFLVLAALAVVRTKLWTYGSDTGTFAQIVADAFGGMRDGVEAGSHFRYHWSPTLALLWPLVALGRSALPLQLLQAAATAACGPLVAAIARPYASARIANALGYVTLLYPPLLALGFDEFHELGLFAPLALGLFSRRIARAGSGSRSVRRAGDRPARRRGADARRFRAGPRRRRALAAAASRWRGRVGDSRWRRAGCWRVTSC